MDLFTEATAVILAGLSFVLASIGATAAARYSDRRLAMVAAALGVIGAVGVLGVLHQVSPLYGGPFDITLVPLLLLLGAVGLVYAAVVTRTIRARPR